MAHPIKFLLLHKDELEYEVLIRNSIPTSTVQELRKQVAKLALEFPSEEIKVSSLDVFVDLKGVGDALDKIKRAFDTELDKNNVARIQNLLHHLHHRLRRITISEDTKDAYNSLVNDYKKYFELFNSIKDNPVEPVVPALNSGESSTPNIPTMIAVSCDRNITGDLNKLKFNGKSCVRAFIQRVSEFSVSRNISSPKLLAYATDIFTDDALHWYRSVRDQVNDWDELALLLKEDFDQPDYDYRLLSEIRARTQGKEEGIIIYLAVMSGLFSRLSKKLIESERLEIILHNIRPCYANILASAPEVTSIETLKSLCRNYENVQARLAHFQEPSGPTTSTLAPELAYKQVQSNKSNNYNKTINNSYRHNYDKNNFRNSVNNSNNSNNLAAVTISRPRYCPRCRVNTHNLRQCEAERSEIYCFVCGRKNVKTPQCPDCIKNKSSSTPKN